MVAKLYQKFVRLSGVLDDGRAKPPLVVDGNIKVFHQGSQVLTETLLARNKRVAVMLKLDLSLAQVISEPDVVERC
jgi:hypothetical protein